MGFFQCKRDSDQVSLEGHSNSHCSLQPLNSFFYPFFEHDLKSSSLVPALFFFTTFRPAISYLIYILAYSKSYWSCGHICFCRYREFFLIKTSSWLAFAFRIKSKLVLTLQDLIPSTLQFNSFLHTTELLSLVFPSLCLCYMNCFPFSLVNIFFFLHIYPSSIAIFVISPKLSNEWFLTFTKIPSTLFLLLPLQVPCSQMIIVSGLKTHWESNLGLTHVYISMELRNTSALIK